MEFRPPGKTAERSKTRVVSGPTAHSATAPRALFDLRRGTDGSSGRRICTSSPPFAPSKIARATARAAAIPLGIQSARRRNRRRRSSHACDGLRRPCAADRPERPAIGVGISLSTTRFELEPAPSVGIPAPGRVPARRDVRGPSATVTRTIGIRPRCRTSQIGRRPVLARTASGEKTSEDRHK